jgi:hypothetical protein
VKITKETPQRSIGYAPPPSLLNIDSRNIDALPLFRPNPGVKRSPRRPFPLLAFLLTATAWAESPEERARRVTVTMNRHDVPPAAAAQFVQVVSNVKVHYQGVPGDKTVLSVNFENTTAHDALSYIADLAKLRLTYQNSGAHFGPK